MTTLGKYIFSYLFLFVLLISTPSTVLAKSTYPYQISIQAVFRDDAPFLKEWIEYHRLIGVEHFWLFNNLSKDDYLSVLQPYLKEGVVELIDWHYESNSRKEWQPVQKKDITEGIRLANKKTKWLAIIDTDEFILPMMGKELIKILDDYANYGAVCANWQRFGTSGVKKIPKDTLMIEALTMRAPRNWELNRWIKSFVRPERVKRVFSSHHMLYKKNYYQVNENKQRFSGQCHPSKRKFDDKKANPQICVDKLRINHYWTRDEDFFFNVKIARRYKEGTRFDLNTYLYYIMVSNQIEDSEILRYAAPLKKRMAESMLN